MLNRVILTSQKINSISEGAENLYYRILLLVDDYGRYYADPDIIKSYCYPKRNLPVSTIKKRLIELTNIKLLKTYKSDEEFYIELIAFQKHQKFRSDIKLKGDFPKPTGFLQRSRDESVTGRIEPERAVGSTSSSVNRNNNRNNNNNEDKKDKKEKDNKEREDDFEKEFESFWKYYRSIGDPKDDIGSKTEARKAYKALRRRVPKNEIAVAAHGEADYLKYKRLDKNFNQNKKFASTWLRSGQWKEHKDFKYTAPL